VRLLRVILEGLLVAAIAALVGYQFRNHLVTGLGLVIGICLLGIVIITWLEKRHEKVATRETLPPENKAWPGSLPAPGYSERLPNDTGGTITRRVVQDADVPVPSAAVEARAYNPTVTTEDSPLFRAEAHSFPALYNLSMWFRVREDLPPLIVFDRVTLANRSTTDAVELEVSFRYRTQSGKNENLSADSFIKNSPPHVDQDKVQGMAARYQTEPVSLSPTNPTKDVRLIFLSPWVQDPRSGVAVGNNIGAWRVDYVEPGSMRLVVKDRLSGKEIEVPVPGDTIIVDRPTGWSSAHTKQTDVLTVAVLEPEVRVPIGGRITQFAVAAKLRIENHTDRPQTVLPKFDAPSPGVWDHAGPIDPESRVKAFWETHELIPSPVPPRKTVEGWALHMLPVYEGEGHPAYSVIVTDDEKNTYTFDMPSWSPRHV
jgi:hypothetical protein